MAKLHESITLEHVLKSVDVPEFCFVPDSWNLAFIRGLLHVNFAGKSILEMGVGTGANIVALAKYHSAFLPKQIMFSDIEPRNIEIAARNIRKQISCHEIVFPLWGSYDLLNRLDGETDDCIAEKIRNVDIIMGCLPQIITPKGINIANGCNIAHYYEQDAYVSDFHECGLGLIDNCLQQAADIAKDSVVLNISGRAGIEKIHEVFVKNSLTPNILHREITPQCQRTSLESYVVVERTSGYSFEFFSDYEGTKKINAQEAEEVRLEGKNVFHYIYVVQGSAR